MTGAVVTAIRILEGDETAADKNQGHTNGRRIPVHGQITFVDAKLLTQYSIMTDNIVIRGHDRHCCGRKREEETSSHKYGHHIDSRKHKGKGHRR